MKTIVKKTIHLETKRHDFDNDLAYLEVWSNSNLKDCFFAAKDFLYPDGTIKNGGKKYFYSKYTGEGVEKEIKSINYATFQSFGKLYYYDENGEVIRWDGTPCEEIESDAFDKE